MVKGRLGGSWQVNFRDEPFEAPAGAAGWLCEILCYVLFSACNCICLGKIPAF